MNSEGVLYPTRQTETLSSAEPASPDDDAPAVTIVVLAYNNAKYIDPCLRAVYGQDFRDFEVVAIDNASSDGSGDRFRRYPVRLIQNRHNRGGCAGINDGIRAASGKYVLLLDIDTEIAPDFVGELYGFMEVRPDVAACCGKLVFHSSGRLNAAGCASNYLGSIWCQGLGSDDLTQPRARPVNSVHGACLFVRRSLLDSLGGYDSDLFLYLEDLDFSWRVLLAGGTLYYVASALCRHHYSVSLSPKEKYYYLERNRPVVVLKHFGAGLLFLTAPMYLVQELGILAYALRHRFLSCKLRAYIWFIKQLPRTLRKRSVVQRTRCRSDLEFFCLLDREFRHTPMLNFATRHLLNPMLRAYGRMVHMVLLAFSQRPGHRPR